MKRAIWYLVVFSIVLVGPSLLAQTVAQAAGAQPPTPTDANEWGASLVWAFLSSSLLEWMKRKPWISVISVNTARYTQRIIGILLALATSLGVHASFETTTGVLTVTGLLWPSVATAVWETVRQFVLTEITYRTAVKPYHLHLASDDSLPPAA